MNCAEEWNKIVDCYERYRAREEAAIQAVWETSVFSTILNYGMSEIDSQRAVQMGSTKKMDIVVQLDGKDLFAVELKRHTARVSDGGQAQLFSYLNQLKSVKIGILICDNLYVYDYDFSKDDAENTESRLEIPFERDNPDGAKFVELFKRENFNAQNVKEFIRTKRQNSKNSELILKEISEETVRALLKKHFAERFSEEDFEIAMNKVSVSINVKDSRPYAASPGVVGTDRRAEIQINGHTFDLYYKHGDEIFQDFVKRTIGKLLKNNLIPVAELERLQELEYSKKTFGLQYALLQKHWDNCIDAGHTRYWSGKFNNEFFVCSQWWKDKLRIYEDKFAEWLKSLSR